MKRGIGLDSGLMPWEASNDEVTAHRFLRPRQREVLVSVFSPFLILIVWEVLARVSLLDVRFFPAPTSIIDTFIQVVKSGELWHYTYTSLTRILVGYVLGAVPAMVLGLVIGRSRLVRAFVNPIIYSLYPVPKVAILPLIMLIFGLGEMSKYVIIAIAVFFLVIMNTISGVVMIEPIYFDVAKNLHASRRDLLLRVLLPGAVPAMFTGLKLAMGVALIVLVTSEFVGAQAGLGVMIFESWQTFSIERLFVGLVSVSFLGYLLSLAFDELERLVLPWRQDR